MPSRYSYRCQNSFPNFPTAKTRQSAVQFRISYHNESLQFASGQEGFSFLYFTSDRKVLFKMNSAKDASFLPVAQNDNMLERYANMLPENSKPYYVPSTTHSLTDIISHLSATERMYINASALTLYPLFFRSMYLNSTERIVVLIGGKHKILQGPGLHWVSVNMYDRLYRTKYTTGQDIIQGPIKLLFVQPGTLKYVWDIQTSRPMLLSPGMHYFDNINIQCNPGGPEEIVLNSDTGENKVIKFGQNGIFKFIFVKTGYKGEIFSCCPHFMSSLTFLSTMNKSHRYCGHQRGNSTHPRTRIAFR